MLMRRSNHKTVHQENKTAWTMEAQRLTMPKPMVKPQKRNKLHTRLLRKRHQEKLLQVKKMLLTLTETTKAKMLLWKKKARMRPESQKLLMLTRPQKRTRRSR